MSLDSLVVTELQKKATAKGVNLNDPAQFKVFTENLARLNLMIEGMIIQTVERYQCQGCGQQAPCTTCEEKRKALEAAQGIEHPIGTPAPVEPPIYLNEDEHY